MSDFGGAALNIFADYRKSGAFPHIERENPEEEFGRVATLLRLQKPLLGSDCFAKAPAGDLFELDGLVIEL